ncbi:MAG: hypothetical protein ABI548_30235, partial [Polyangiaceae bacterium]
MSGPPASAASPRGGPYASARSGRGAPRTRAIGDADTRALVDASKSAAQRHLARRRRIYAALRVRDS